MSNLLTDNLKARDASASKNDGKVKVPPIIQSAKESSGVLMFSN